MVQTEKFFCQRYAKDIPRDMNNTPTVNDEIEIDLLHIVKILWQKIWIIIISMVLLGAALFSYAVFMITPQYQAKAMMYVNNSSISIGATSFSLSELSAAQSLLDVYVIILQSRTTLEKVIEKANLDYTYEQLASRVTAESVNETEIFRIVATSSNPAEAELIVDTIVEILPDRIAEIVDGSSVRVVDYAVLPTQRSSPSYTRYAMIGLLLGFVLSCGAIIVLDLMDTTVRSEDYLYQKYSNIPMLAVVPDAHDTHKGSYSYYYKESADTAKKE